MRVLGLLFLVAALPVWAAEDHIKVAFARFAYADTSAFQSRFVQAPSAASMNIEKRLPRLPLEIFGEENLIDQPPETPLPMVASAEAELSPPARIVIARAEPETVAPVHASAPLTAQPPQVEQRVAALPEPMHLLPTSPPAEIEATEFAPVLPEPKNREPSPRRTTRVHQAKPVHSYKPSASKNKPAQKPEAEKSPAKIPRWAEQMFSSNWQNRAFAYQQ